MTNESKFRLPLANEQIAATLAETKARNQQEQERANMPDGIYSQALSGGQPRPPQSEVWYVVYVSRKSEDDWRRLNGDATDALKAAREFIRVDPQWDYKIARVVTTETDVEFYPAGTAVTA